MPYFSNNAFNDNNNIPSGYEDINIGIQLNYVFDGQNWIRHNPSGFGAATEETLEEINSKLVDGNDIGDVTINNTAGSGAVNVQDGGNSITIDDGGVALRTQGHIAEGAPASGTNPVVVGFKDIFGNVAIPTTLNAAGFNVIATLIADAFGNTVLVTNNAVFIGGDEAHDAVDAGNPIKTGGKATSGIPAAVANNDRVNARFNTIGQQITTLAGYSTGDPVDIEDDQGGKTGLNVQCLLQRSDYIKCMSSQVFDNTNVNTDVFGGEELPCKRGSEIELYVTIDSFGVGNHNIQLGFEFSIDDGATWYRVDHGFEQAIWFEDTETASPINRCYVIPSRGDRMRVFGRSRNTTALLTFTVDIFAKERTNP